MLTRRGLFAGLFGAVAAAVAAPFVKFLTPKATADAYGEDRVYDGTLTSGGTYRYYYDYYRDGDEAWPTITLDRPFSAVDGRIYTNGTCKMNNRKFTFSGPWSVTDFST